MFPVHCPFCNSTHWKLTYAKSKFVVLNFPRRRDVDMETISGINECVCKNCDNKFWIDSVQLQDYQKGRYYDEAKTGALQ